MTPKKRRELLSRLEKAQKQDGWTDQRSQNELFAETLHELVMDSVYLSIPEDADATEALEVQTAADA